MPKNIDGLMLKKMFISAFSALEENKTLIDELNVFPVPDGDTGTNMTLTMRSSITELSTINSIDIADICVSVNKGVLKGARGNSGVILSQIIRGICSVLMECKEISVKDLVKAFAEGSNIAYKAVTKPKEGTILTIIKAVADESKSVAKSKKGIAEFLQEVIDRAEKVLQRTPDMLPILKQAGVVDAGGRGLIVILSGMYKAISGEDVNVEFVDNVQKDLSAIDNHFDFTDLGEIEFAYCTEYFIIKIKERTTESDIDLLRNKLCEIGDSVICIGDLDLIKVHVHTNEPNKALGYALKLGELNGIKIENMVQQNRELRENQKPKKEFAIVSVASGDGLEEIFKDLGVDYVLTGGQTMNPSANDIATACDKVNAKNVFVLPNNKNIILAANQANDITNSNVVVIDTKTIPEGVSACLAFADCVSLEENIENMSNSFDHIVSGSVTYAVRDTETDGFELQKGDIIGLSTSAILSKSNTVEDCTVDLVEKLIKDDHTNVTIFFGKDITEEDANTLALKLNEKYPDVDIVCAYGGQSVYYFFISIE